MDPIEAYILGSHSYGESHKIMVGFSPVFGEIKLIAYGIRKAPSRFGSDLEFLNQILIETSKPFDFANRLFPLKEYQLIKSNYSIRENANLTMYLYYFVDFINVFIRRREEVPLLYDTMQELLLLCENLQQDAYTIIRASQLRLLDKLGYIPDLRTCSNCSRTLEHPVFINSEPGWVLCHQCGNPRWDVPFSSEDWKIVQSFMNTSLESHAQQTVSTDQRKCINIMFNRIIYSLFGKSLKTDKFIK